MIRVELEYGEAGEWDLRMMGLTSSHALLHRYDIVVLLVVGEN